MTLNEYLEQEKAMTAAELEAYKRLQEASGLMGDDETDDVSFNDWHNDMSMAATMGLLKDDKEKKQ